MRMTVITNLAALANVRRDGVDVRVLPFAGVRASFADQLRSCWRAAWADYVVINCSPHDLFLACACKLLMPFGRSRVVSLDTVLPVPHPGSASRRLVLRGKKLLFSQVDLFIEYFKETAGYERHYGIPRRKFRYVPFKINRYERVLKTPTSDQGYIFCGGNTRRDFGTLIAAIRDLPYKVRIVTMRDAVIEASGTTLDEKNLPPNVEVVRHDGSESFLDHVAGARLVALPIRRENISASGIGVYLASMALGKCVIISEGPAVNGVVPDGAAVLVPPEDPAALHEAIRRAYTDDEYRRRIAEAGQAYALSLKGEERLCESVLDVLLADRSSRLG